MTRNKLVLLTRGKLREKQDKKNWISASLVVFLKLLVRPASVYFVIPTTSTASATTFVVIISTSTSATAVVAVVSSSSLSSKPVWVVAVVAVVIVPAARACCCVRALVVMHFDVDILWRVLLAACVRRRQLCGHRRPYNGRRGRRGTLFYLNRINQQENARDHSPQRRRA